MKDDYMVYFKFKLSPTEAENFAYLFTKDIADLNSAILDETAKQDLAEEDKQSRITWLKARIEYMKEMQDTVIGSSKAINVEDGEVRIDSVNEWDKD